MRLAFGTFLGLPDPTQFMGDADYVVSRFRSNPLAAFAAELEGELLGSVFAARWGSFAFFGPLTVHPELWDQGIAKRLLEPVMDLFDSWAVTHAGLFTWAQSPKHIHLYQRFGFWGRYLTAIMSKPVGAGGSEVSWSRYSSHPNAADGLAACRELTDAVFPGLDLAGEIEAVRDQGLGDTVLLWDGESPAGVAVCHCGPGTEAGGGSCYVKFGAVRPGPGAGEHFERLLDACEELAAGEGLERLTAGANMGRAEAYRALLARGFRTQIQGVAMERDNQPGYNLPGSYVIDDWR